VVLCGLDLAVERWYTLSPLYAFTSLVSLTVVFGIWCFMFPTLNRSRPRHDSGEEFASSYQPLSKPSIPPCSPHETQVPNSCLHLPTNYHLPLVPSLSHHPPVPSNRVCRLTLWSSIFQLLGRTPFFPHSVGSSIRHRVAIAVFCSRSVPVFFYFVSKSLLFRPFVGLLAGVVAFPLRRSPSLLRFKVCCFRSLVHLVRYGLSVDLSASSEERRRKMTS